MAYRHCGEGDPVVFLHGNPTSSYLWRRVLRHVQHLGRCVAPDLIGMGLSQKLAHSDAASYRFVEHRRFLDALLEHLGVHERVVLIGHDWGGVLAMDWARRHPQAVRAIAYMETLTGPMSWAGPNAPSPDLFGPLRTAAGEPMVLLDNVFVEKVLPSGTQWQLGEEEMDTYRAPLPSARRVSPPDVDVAARDTHRRSAERRSRDRGGQLRLDGHQPRPQAVHQRRTGGVLTGPLRVAARSWPHQREITVPGLHFLPEDSPNEIGVALAEWMALLP
jgi:haloalkane dehalogenase